MPRRLQILSVEDHRLYAELLEAIFTARGHIVCTANNGREAWELAEADMARFDLVVTDHQMPEMKGSQLVANLRGRQFPGRIIVHAANLSSADEDAYRHLRVDHIVTKGEQTGDLLFLAEKLFAS